MENDVGHRVKTAGRQMLGGRNEVARRIVDQPGQPTGGKQRLDHLVHRLGHADVHPKGVDAPARVLGAPGFRRGVANRFAPAANGHVGTQGQEVAGHGLAQAGAATGDQNALAGHELGLKHQEGSLGLGLRAKMENVPLAILTLPVAETPV